ncbi:MAG: citrate/2-methylcitrate synthase [Vicinamibacterales bacterium]
MTTPAFLPAREAAARIGVKPATLYAYVSRGRLRAFTLPGRRGSWFDPVQLDAVGARAQRPRERRPDLRIVSAVTLIDRGAFWYRGRRPQDLARTHAFEQVAEYLWNGAATGAHPPWRADRAGVRAARKVLKALPGDVPPVEALRFAVSAQALEDPLRFDRRPSGLVVTARRLMATALAAVSGRVDGAAAAQVAAWIGARPEATRLAAIDDVLVLMADHELAASTVAVRVAASFGADPYAAVAAGFGAMSGTRHGAASRRLEEALASMARRVPPGRAAMGLLGDDGTVPGFGHPLYPDGDPRVPPILALAARLGPTMRADRLRETLQAQGASRPNVDFALAAFTHALGVAPGAGEALFTAARLAGWLAHAMEEYASRTDFRLRAIYSGDRPD